jgi:hypothetical protein
VLTGSTGTSRNLDGRRLKRYRRRMESDGNEGLILFQRRVLFEVLDEKQMFHMSKLFYSVRLLVVGITPTLRPFVLPTQAERQNIHKHFNET